MVLELAVEAECEYIVTHNQRDFAGAGRFGVRIVTPKEFLQARGLPR
jgi:predicted nucleic acid-binding protein